MNDLVTIPRRDPARDPVVVWRSVEAVRERPSAFAEVFRIARTALAVWGGVSLVALGAYSLGTLNLPNASGTTEATEIAFMAPVPAPEPARTRVVPVPAMEPAKKPAARPVRAAPIERPESPPAVLTPEPAAAERTVVARLPRSRPDAPIVTGSIGKRMQSADERRRSQRLLRYGTPLDYYRYAQRSPRTYPVHPFYVFER